MVNKRIAKLFAGAVYCIMNSSDWTQDMLDGRRKITELLSLGRDSPIAELENKLANYSNHAILNKLLNEHFHLEVLQNESNPRVAVFRDIIPQLSDYALVHGADNLAYDEQLLSNGPSSNQRIFSRLDSVVRRAHKTWVLDIPNSPDNIEITPITQVNEIHEFRGLNAEFCYFDPKQNHAQMYLYAAHHNTTMLGVWQTTMTNRIPLGIIPVLLMQNEKTKPGTQQVQGLPFLYVESVMLKSGCIDNLVRTNEKTTSLSDALIDVIASYTSLLEVEAYPLIGTCRKDDSMYSGTTKSFIDAASSRWRKLFSNKVGQRSIVNPLTGQNRAGTKPRFENSYHLFLPEDVVLLSYLQQRGYSFPTTVMESHAFLNEDEIKQKNNDNSPGRKVLYNQWGEMKGWTNCVPIPSYYDLQRERIFSRRDVL